MRFVILSTLLITRGVLAIPVSMPHCPVDRSSWGIGWNWARMEEDILGYNHTAVKEKFDSISVIQIDDLVNTTGECKDGCKVNVTTDAGDFTVEVPVPPSIRKGATVRIGKQTCFLDPVDGAISHYYITTYEENLDSNSIKPEAWSHQTIAKTNVVWPKTDGCFIQNKGGLVSTFLGAWFKRPRNWLSTGRGREKLDGVYPMKLAWNKGVYENRTTVQAVPGGCVYYINNTQALDDFMLGPSGMSLAWGNGCYCVSIRAPGYVPLPAMVPTGGYTVSPRNTECRATSIDEDLTKATWSNKRMGAIGWSKAFRLDTSYTMGIFLVTKILKGDPTIMWHFVHPESRPQGIFQRNTVIPSYFEDYPSLLSAKGAVWGSIVTAVQNGTRRLQLSHWGTRGIGAWTPIMGAWIPKGDFTHERINVRSASDAAKIIQNEQWSKVTRALAFSGH